MNDLIKGKIAAWILWIVGISLLAMGGIFLLAYISMPVVEMVGEALGVLSSAFNIRRGNSIQSLAVICIIIIGIVGIVKVLTRKR